MSITFPSFDKPIASVHAAANYVKKLKLKQNKWL